MRQLAGAILLVLGAVILAVVGPCALLHRMVLRIGRAEVEE